MVINHLLNGMILQVGKLFKEFYTPEKVDRLMGLRPKHGNHQPRNLIWVHPWKTNILGTQSHGALLQMIFRISIGCFLGSMLFFGGVSCSKKIAVQTTGNPEEICNWMKLEYRNWSSVRERGAGGLNPEGHSSSKPSVSGAMLDFQGATLSTVRWMEAKKNQLHKKSSMQQSWG